MREDGDTWDIVSSVGRTALAVATFRALESERPDALISDPFARWFVEAANDPQFVALLSDSSALEKLPFFFPRFMGLRTKFFDDFFTTATADGVRQVVIVAAGLDDRAYRLTWPPGTVVFEIDRARVLEFKSGVLDSHGTPPTSDRRPVAVDLRDDWPATLAEAGFVREHPTAWSAEGLLPYLPGPAHDALFERIDALSTGGSRLALDGFGTSHGFARFAAVREKYFGGKSFFGNFDVTHLFYADARVDPAGWLGEHAWDVRTSSIAELIAAYHLRLPPLPDELSELTRTEAYLTAAKNTG